MEQTKVKVVLHTEQHPEDNAMLQALYSRSADSVTDHIEKLKQVGSGKFMNQYYLGYGHSSIADCGFITVYIEGISMLAAKAIQDNPLYNGQESSSRYIDWSEQPFHNPYKDTQYEEQSEKLLEAYRNFYTSQKPVIVEHLTQMYPKKEDEKQTVYDKAILAKAFDILRGYLPCGATTNVAWTSSLRKINEHLQYLVLSPLDEVRDVARQIHAIVSTEYPNSIAALPEPSEVDPYMLDMVHYYSSGFDLTDTFYEVATNKDLEIQAVPEASKRLMFPELYADRPKRANLPKHDVSLQTRTDYYFKLDFGSYRDLQRHRGGYCSVPAIDNTDGFHPWYYEQAPLSTRLLANELFRMINNMNISVIGDITINKSQDELSEDDIDLLTTVKLANQYLLPMGTLVNLNLNYNVHQSLYVAELRSGQTVHATLRPVAQAMGKYLEKQYGVKTYCDYSEDAWNIRRGNQDITSKLV